MATQKPKKSSGAKKPPKNQKQVQTTLDDVLVALQKSFSRVSTKSADVPPDQARAMVSGQVSFEMSLTVNLEEDYLHPNTKGAIGLKLSGNIDTDIRTVEEGLTD
jgi:hypothetical protein